MYLGLATNSGLKTIGYTYSGFILQFDVYYLFLSAISAPGSQTIPVNEIVLPLRNKGLHHLMVFTELREPSSITNMVAK